MRSSLPRPRVYSLSNFVLLLSSKHVLPPGLLRPSWWHLSISSTPIAAISVLSLPRVTLPLPMRRPSRATMLSITTAIGAMVTPLAAKALVGRRRTVLVLRRRAAIMILWRTTVLMSLATVGRLLAMLSVTARTMLSLRWGLRARTTVARLLAVAAGTGVVI